jgi:hypothetical protein
MQARTIALLTLLAAAGCGDRPVLESADDASWRSPAPSTLRCAPNHYDPLDAGDLFLETEHPQCNGGYCIQAGSADGADRAHCTRRCGADHHCAYLSGVCGAKRPICAPLMRLGEVACCTFCICEGEIDPRLTAKACQASGAPSCAR